MISFQYNDIYIYIIIFLLLILSYYIYNSFNNKFNIKNVKKYVDNLKKDKIRIPCIEGSGRDYIITKYYNILTSKECDFLIKESKNKGLDNSIVYANGGMGSSVKDEKQRIS